MAFSIKDYLAGKGRIPLFKDMPEGMTVQDLMITSLLSKFEARGNAILRGELMAPEAEQAAGGKLLKTIRRETTILSKKRDEAGRLVVTQEVNTFTNARELSYLAKVWKAVGKPVYVLGFIGTAAFSRAWATNEISDATTTLIVAARDARYRGDVETALKYGNIIKDIAEPSIWDRIVREIPTVNVAVASWDKVKVAREVAVDTDEWAASEEGRVRGEEDILLRKASLMGAETSIAQQQERFRQAGSTGEALLDEEGKPMFDEEGNQIFKPIETEEEYLAKMKAIGYSQATDVEATPSEIAAGVDREAARVEKARVAASQRAEMLKPAATGGSASVRINQPEVPPERKKLKFGLLQ